MWDSMCDYWDINHPHYTGNVLNYEEKIKQREQQNEMVKIRRFQNIVAQRKKYTPDFMDLKIGATVFPVFITGDERSFGVHQSMLDKCPYLGLGYTGTDDYVLLNNKGIGQKSIVFKANRELANDMRYAISCGRSVQGELYAVTLDKLCDLDKKNQNGEASTRETVMVRYIDKNGQSSHQRAFFYVGLPSYWKARPSFGPGSLQLASSITVSKAPRYERDSYYFYRTD